MKIPLREDLGTRVVKDIDTILRNGWADEISRRDFYHGHICTYPKDEKPVIKDEGLLQNNLNLSHVLILYHSHEADEKLEDPNRNILSDTQGNIRVVSTSQCLEYYRRLCDYSQALELHRKGIRAVYARDLWLDELFDFEFEYGVNGKYQLENGKRINISIPLRKSILEFDFSSFKL